MSSPRPTVESEEDAQIAAALEAIARLQKAKEERLERERKEKEEQAKKEQAEREEAKRKKDEEEEEKKKKAAAAAAKKAAAAAAKKEKKKNPQREQLESEQLQRSAELEVEQLEPPISEDDWVQEGAPYKPPWH
jgi:hypothetical protein